MRDGVEFHVEEYRGAGFRTVSVVAELGGVWFEIESDLPLETIVDVAMSGKRRERARRGPGADPHVRGALALASRVRSRVASLGVAPGGLHARGGEAARRRSGSVAVFGESSLEPEEPVESEELWRLWMARPDKVRAEFAVGHGETVTAVWGPRDGTRQVRRAHVSALGVSAEKTVITYDDFNTTFAARLWRVLNYYRHTDAKVLNGGWDRWLAESRPITRDEAEPEPARFTARPNEEVMCRLDYLKARYEAPDIQVMNVLPEAHYRGEANPFENKRVGHIPGSVNIPIEEFLSEEEHGVFKSAGGASGHPGEARALARTGDRRALPGGS